MKHTLIKTLLVVSAVVPVVSIAASDHGSHQMAQAQASVDSQMVEGQIKKIDKSAGKLTLSHGPLPNLGMPAMTMVFRVKDSTWLEQMKEGDKIRFLADKVNGAFTVVEFKAAQ